MADIQMDDDPKGAQASHPFDAAIQAMRFKKPPPQIDFTLHTMDDGTSVNTLDRVCKGERPPPSELARLSKTIRVLKICLVRC
jgi:hypothetical protein